MAGPNFGPTSVATQHPRVPAVAQFGYPQMSFPSAHQASTANPHNLSRGLPATSQAVLHRMPFTTHSSADSDPRVVPNSLQRTSQHADARTAGPPIPQYETISPPLQPSAQFENISPPIPPNAYLPTKNPPMVPWHQPVHGTSHPASLPSRDSRSSNEGTSLAPTRQSPPTSALIQHQPQKRQRQDPPTQPSHSRPPPPADLPQIPRPPSSFSSNEAPSGLKRESSDCHSESSDRQSAFTVGTRSSYSSSSLAYRLRIDIKPEVDDEDVDVCGVGEISSAQASTSVASSSVAAVELNAAAGTSNGSSAAEADAAPLQCVLCEETFENRDELVRHFFDSELPSFNPEDLSCGICVDGAADRKLTFKTVIHKIDHVLTDHGLFKKLKCAECEATFWFDSEMKEHVRFDGCGVGSGEVEGEGTGVESYDNLSYSIY